MKVLIVCFSQTGNTQKLADKICEGIVDAGNTCTIAGMKHADIGQIPKYDLFGVGTPTFFYREPLNVRAFIQKLPDAGGQPCFLFCSHGSIMGNTLYYMRETLTEKGYTVIGVFDSYADASLQFFPKIWHTEGHPDDIELEEAFEFGKSICETAAKVQNGAHDLIPKVELIEDTWWSETSKQITPASLRKRFPRFSIDLDKCTQCLKCQEDCPVEAIDIQADPPEIQKKGCIFCLYCQKACPEGAIEADWSALTEMTRGNLAKYVEVLKAAEKAGRFRPYVDYQKIV